MSKYGNFENRRYVNEPNFYTGTFDLLVFKVNWGSFGALVSKWPVTQKQVSVEKSGVTIGTQG